MRKLFLIFIIIFLAIAIGLPCFVGVLIRQTQYTAGDIIGYIATILGISISLIALYLSVLQYIPRLKIERIVNLYDIGSYSTTNYTYMKVTNMGAASVIVTGINISLSVKNVGRRRIFKDYCKIELDKYRNVYPHKLESGASANFYLLPTESLDKMEKLGGIGSDTGLEFAGYVIQVSLASGRMVSWRPKIDGKCIWQRIL